MRICYVDRNLMKDIVKRQMEFFGHIIRKEELELVTGFIEGKRTRFRQRKTYLQNMKGMTPIEHRTDPTCLRERCLVTVVQIAACVNMIWHTMMMIQR